MHSAPLWRLLGRPARGSNPAIAAHACNHALALPAYGSVHLPNRRRTAHDIGLLLLWIHHVCFRLSSSGQQVTANPAGATIYSLCAPTLWSLKIKRAYKAAYHIRRHWTRDVF